MGLGPVAGEPRQELLRDAVAVYVLYEQLLLHNIY